MVLVWMKRVLLRGPEIIGLQEFQGGEAGGSDRCPVDSQY